MIRCYNEQNENGEIRCYSKAPDPLATLFQPEITMRSLLWTSVFLVLMAEIAITFVLVIPVPRKWRNKICLQVSQLDLKKRLQKPLIFLVVGMSLAFLDSLNYLFILWKEEDEDVRYRDYRSAEEAHMIKHLDKEKAYKAQRNLYLSGFAITLLFAIGRITSLMQEHAELEVDLEKLRQSSSPPVDSSTGDNSTGQEIEMKPIQSKKKD